MFDGNWFKRHSVKLTGIVLAALLIFGATVLIGYGLERQAEYERYADERRKEYTANTYSPERQRCFRLTAGRQQDCVTKARNEATAYNREQQDLVAQRVTALWTKLMGGAAIIGMGLSAFGVFLVWTTFNATREANVIANEANRPWLELVITEKREFFIKPTHTRVALFASLTNRGKSPATCVRPRAVLVAVPESGSHHHDAINLLNRQMDEWEATQPDSWITIFPGVKQKGIRLGYNIVREKLDEAVGGPGNKARFWVALGVSYKFGNKWCRTSHGYMITFPRRPQTRDVSETVVLGPSEFVLAPMAQDYAT